MAEKETTVETTASQPLARAHHCFELFRGHEQNPPLFPWLAIRMEQRLVGLIGCSIRIRGQQMQGKSEEGVVESI